MQRFQALSTINQTFLLHSRSSSVEINQSRLLESNQARSTGINHSRCPSIDIVAGKDDIIYCPSSSETRQAVSPSSSWRSLPTDQQSWLSDQTSSVNALKDYSSSDSQVGFAFIVKK